MRALAALVLVTLVAGGAGTRPPAEAVAHVLTPRATDRLPAWRAPGGRLTVEGKAGAGATVRLRIGARLAAEATTGRDGRFRLHGFAPTRSGHYPVRVESGGGGSPAGRLRVRPVELAAVGDVTFGSEVATAIAARGVRYPWLRVARELRAADLATANLETAVSNRGLPVAGKEYHFRGPPSALRAAARFAGLDVVSVANNHSLDFGRAAFLDTLRHARAAGLATVGGGRDLTTARRPAIFDRGGLRVAFLGYSDVRPLGFDAGAGIAGTAPARPELIAADVRSALLAADLAVVWFHWGEELARRPAWRQQELAAAALNAGATLVLGAHPHVLQPIDAPDPRRLVAWSLGNFVFPAFSPGTTSTGLLIVHLGRQGVAGHRLRRARIDGVQPRFEPRQVSDAPRPAISPREMGEER